MQALSTAKEGTYTIQWMFGLPEILEQLRDWNISEGKEIRVIAAYRDAVLIGSDSRRFIIDNVVAQRIKV